MPEVNLDALIPREDLEIREPKSQGGNNVLGINISQLRRGEFFLESLRKPDFQRETSEWSPEKVKDIIASFANGDLIPSVILWRGEGYVFIIDGAHRLSALIAWVMDDYGDRSDSIAFFGQNIDPQQLKIADEARKLISKEVGSYADIQWAMQNPDKADPNRLAIARRLSSLAIQLQWVPGDASQAESSFFKINESPSPIDKTEKRLLNARKKPSAIATRAIINAGSGHKYWSKFTDKNQSIIVELSGEISDLLFKPQLETPIKTLDIPLAGKRNSPQTMELMLNVVNFCNNIKIVDSSKIRKDSDFPENTMPDDNFDGLETIKYLENTKNMLCNITGQRSSSLGLHPAIYFYSLQARYQVTAFLGMLNLIKDYETRKQLKKFTKIRKYFEEFLWKNKEIVNQAQPTWGSGAKGYKQLAGLFDYIIKLMIDGKNESEIIALLDAHNEYNFYKPGGRVRNPKHRKTFSSESKSEVFMKEAVTNALRCKICGGFLHKSSMQIDHIEAKEDGGIGNSDNGQLVHPYCNSIRKDLIADGFYNPKS